MGKDRKELTFVARRREICDKCENLTTMIGAKVCKSCGCSIWGKTMIPNAKCPKGKWNAE
jgi:hypothetical protein